MFRRRRESASHTDSRHGGLTRRQGSRDCWGTGTGEIVDPLYEDFVITPAAGSLLSARFATRPLTVTEAGVSGLERSLAGRPSASVCWQHDSIRPLGHAATESLDRNAEIRAGCPLRYPAMAHSTSSHPQGVNACVVGLEPDLATARFETKWIRAHKNTGENKFHRSFLAWD